MQFRAPHRNLAITLLLTGVAGCNDEHPDTTSDTDGTAGTATAGTTTAGTATATTATTQTTATAGTATATATAGGSGSQAEESEDIDGRPNDR